MTQYTPRASEIRVEILDASRGFHGPFIVESTTIHRKLAHIEIIEILGWSRKKGWEVSTGKGRISTPSCIMQNLD